MRRPSVASGSIGPASTPVCGPGRRSTCTGRGLHAHGASWNTVPRKGAEMTVGAHLRSRRADRLSAMSIWRRASRRGGRRGIGRAAAASTRGRAGSRPRGPDRSRSLWCAACSPRSRAPADWCRAAPSAGCRRPPASELGPARPPSRQGRPAPRRRPPACGACPHGRAGCACIARGSAASGRRGYRMRPP